MADGGRIDVRGLVVDLSMRFGGASSRALGLLCAMPAEGVSLAAIEGSAVERQATFHGLDVVAVGRRKADPRIAARLRRAMAARSAGFLDSQNVQSKFWCAAAARSTGVALVSTLNSWYPSEYAGRMRGILYHGIERITAPRTDLYIVVSADIRDRLLAERVAPDAVVLIPNAIDVESCRVTVERGWLAGRFGIPARAPVCAAVGRLVPAKGHRNLICALAEPGLRSVHCVVVGDGELGPELRRLARAVAVEERVHWSGYLEPADVRRIVRASDLFVLPSVSEGTPLALLEAAALAAPIVATTVGGVGEVVSNGEHALLVPAADPVALAAAIRRILDAPADAAAMALRAQRHVAERHGIQAQVAATLAAYRRACERAARRASRPGRG